MQMATAQDRRGKVVNAFIVAFRRPEGRIELCGTAGLIGVYGSHMIYYAPGEGFRKFGRAWAHGIWHRTGRAATPLVDEIAAFKLDVMLTAAKEPGVGNYLSGHAELRP